MPVWHVDHIVSLKQSVAGHVQQVEIAPADWHIPGTQVEPFASIPLFLPNTSIFMEEAESYNLHKHLNVFKQGDMPDGQSVTRPIVIPFSSMLPDLADLYSKAAKAYAENDDVTFSGECKTQIQLEYPILLPFYLVEVVDRNPQYHGETVTFAI